MDIGVTKRNTNVTKSNTVCAPRPPLSPVHHNESISRQKAAVHTADIHAKIRCNKPSNKPKNTDIPRPSSPLNRAKDLYFYAFPVDLLTSQQKRYTWLYGFQYFPPVYRAHQSQAEPSPPALASRPLRP